MRKMIYFSTKEVTRYAGFKSEQMVHYLHRTGVAIPSGRATPGRGKKRQYTLGDVVVLKAINRLLESGLPVSRLKEGINKIRKDLKNISPDSAIHRYMITDGKSVYLNESPDYITELNADGQMAFAFIIDIKEVKKDVVQKATDAGKYANKSA